MEAQRDALQAGFPKEAVETAVYQCIQALQNECAEYKQELEFVSHERSQLQAMHTEMDQHALLAQELRHELAERDQRAHTERLQLRSDHQQQMTALEMERRTALDECYEIQCAHEELRVRMATFQTRAMEEMEQALEELRVDHQRAMEKRAIEHQKAMEGSIEHQEHLRHEVGTLRRVYQQKLCENEQHHQQQLITCSNNWHNKLHEAQEECATIADQASSCQVSQQADQHRTVVVELKREATEAEAAHKQTLVRFAECQAWLLEFEEDKASIQAAYCKAQELLESQSSTVEELRSSLEEAEHQLDEQAAQHKHTILQSRQQFVSQRERELLCFQEEASVARASAEIAETNAVRTQECLAGTEWEVQLLRERCNGYASSALRRQIGELRQLVQEAQSSSRWNQAMSAQLDERSYVDKHIAKLEATNAAQAELEQYLRLKVVNAEDSASTRGVSPSRGYWCGLPGSMRHVQSQFAPRAAGLMSSNGGLMSSNGGRSGSFTPSMPTTSRSHALSPRYSDPESPDWLAGQDLSPQSTPCSVAAAISPNQARTSFAPSIWDRSQVSSSPRPAASPRPRSAFAG